MVASFDGWLSSSLASRGSGQVRLGRMRPFPLDPTRDRWSRWRRQAVGWDDQGNAPYSGCRRSFVGFVRGGTFPSKSDQEVPCDYSINPLNSYSPVGLSNRARGDRARQRWGSWHWGQGGTYPGDTLRIHCDFIINSSRHYPGDTCWNLLQSTLHFDHNVSSDHMLVTFSMYPPK